MKYYNYILVGGGMSADSAGRGIRKVDRNGSIALFSIEADAPYNRPPLSKGLWQKTPLERIWRKTAELGVDLFLERRIIELDPRQKCVRDELGEEYRFDKLLLASGAAPIRLDAEGERLLYYRTLEDYRRLRSLTESGERFVIIGGGFIGSELAAVLATQGKKVSMVFLEDGIGGRIFPAEIAHYLNDRYRQNGIEVLPNERVVAVEQQAKQVRVRTASGKQLLVDGVVAGLGVHPNLELAKNAGLSCGRGITVDRHLRTEHPDIFAAGDVVEFYNPALQRRLRVEHEENANQGGLLAGMGMAGELQAYDLLPSFYADLFDISYQAVGELEPRLRTLAKWKEPFKEGTIYYLEEDRLVGMLLWNKPYHQLEAARALIDAVKPVRDEMLEG